MEGDAFDGLARKLATLRSRRGMLRLGVVGIIGTALGSLKGAGTAEAGSSTCRGTGSRCSSSKQCCSGTCKKNKCTAPAPTQTPTSAPTNIPTNTPTNTPTTEPTTTPTNPPDCPPIDTSQYPPEFLERYDPYISAGCQTINEFGGGGVRGINFTFTYAAGEQIAVQVEQLSDESPPPPPPTVELYVDGVLVDQGTTPTTLTYTIPTAGTHAIVMQTVPESLVTVLTNCVNPCSTSGLPGYTG